MDNTLPKIEILPEYQESHQRAAAKHPYRLMVFIAVFLFSLILSLVYVYSRPALFQSYATLLTVAQTAIDEQSSEADIQHVAIQRQILLGQELLAETLSRLQQSEQFNQRAAEHDFSPQLSVAEVRSLLSVQEIPETNLVKLAATGYRATLFEPLINTWIKVYLDRRTDEIRQTTGVTIDILKQELLGLEHKILAKRNELEQFRTANNITSLGRENIFENESLARFKGLNQSLSEANEEAIKSKAHLDAVNKAIAEGKMVVPDQDKRSMRVLELRLQELKEQLADFDRKYTRSYLALQPNLNVLPEKIKALELEIQRKRQYGQSIVLTEAEQKYNAAQQALFELNKQLEEYRREATDFSSKFSQHEALMNGLDGLEKLQRSTRERLVQIEAKQAEKFPQVKVIEWAFQPREPISPDYTRDAIIALAASVLMGLFSVWLVEFLTRKESPRAAINISGINMYHDTSLPSINHAQTVREPLSREAAAQALRQDGTMALEDDTLSMASDEIIASLLEASDLKGKQLIALLLSGMQLDEISRLTNEHIDFAQQTIKVTGVNSRSILLNKALRSLFQQDEICPVWNKTPPVSEQTLEAILVYACADAGLGQGNQVTAQSISNAYIIYLVKQGLRLSELAQIVGELEPTRLSEYSRHSPEQIGLSVNAINLQHPTLAALVDS